MENFREMTQEFLEREALVQLRARTDRELVVELSQALARILTDKAWASRLSVNAQAAVEANRGATRRHVAIIDRFIMST
jgi:3-deoxy-D-manno-octulosonic-acid transferase